MAREMKDSGIKWIGEIGFDFYMMKLKYVSIILDQFRKPVTADQRNQEGDMLYDYYGASGVIDKINDYTIDDHVMLIGEDGANLKMRNLPLMYEVNGKAWINNHAHILKPKQGIDYYYLFYVLEAIDINPYITGSAQPKLSQENLKNIWIPVPDVSKQKEIACYIKGACMEIDNVLEKTRVSIEEYKKLKQAVITQAVTKGIRDGREMKDSGIAWVGEIPVEWEVSQVKYSLRWKSEKGQPQEEVLSLYRDYGIVPKDSRDDNHNVTSLDTSGYKVVDIGDFVINKMKAWQGSMAVSEYRGIISPAYHVCEFTNDKINRKYFHYLMRNKSYIPEYTRLSTGMRVGQWDLGFNDFKNILFLLPPRGEQQEIANYLDQKCSAIDELIAKKEQYLSEIENYKNSLIYEYVTGKKEV